MRIGLFHKLLNLILAVAVALSGVSMAYAGAMEGHDCQMMQHAEHQQHMMSPADQDTSDQQTPAVCQHGMQGGHDCGAMTHCCAAMSDYGSTPSAANPVLQADPEVTEIGITPSTEDEPPRPHRH